VLNDTNLSEYVRKYATEEALREQENQGVSSDSESSMSDFSEDEAQDMEL
jgi:ubiquitin-conjugating enzyme E2 H